MKLPFKKLMLLYIDIDWVLLPINNSYWKS